MPEYTVEKEAKLIWAHDFALSLGVIVPVMRHIGMARRDGRTELLTTGLSGSIHSMCSNCYLTVYEFVS